MNFIKISDFNKESQFVKFVDANGKMVTDEIAEKDGKSWLNQVWNDKLLTIPPFLVDYFSIVVSSNFISKKHADCILSNVGADGLLRFDKVLIYKSGVNQRFYNISTIVDFKNSVLSILNERYNSSAYDVKEYPAPFNEFENVDLLNDELKEHYYTLKKAHEDKMRDYHDSVSFYNEALRAIKEVDYYAAFRLLINRFNFKNDLVEIKNLIKCDNADKLSYLVVGDYLNEEA